jgi:hypothetical protein
LGWLNKVKSNKVKSNKVNKTKQRMKTLLIVWAVSVIINIVLTLIERRRGFFYMDSGITRSIFMYAPFSSTLWAVAGLGVLAAEAIRGEL